MFTSRTRMIGLVAVLAAIGPASVADAKTRPYSSKIVSSPLSTANGYPGIGGTAYLAGSLQSKPFGAGAIIDHVTVTGRPWAANVFTFEGTEVALHEHGTVRSTFTGHSILLEDGSQEITLRGRITDGTERFRGATGRYKFKGTVPSGSTVLTGGSTGRITF
jgi:hypothetical protein